jgi:hypothetical protein
MNLENTPFAPLMPHLLDLLQTLEPHGIPLILAGGSGLLLRREWLEASGTPSLITKPAKAMISRMFSSSFVAKYVSGTGSKSPFAFARVRSRFLHSARNSARFGVYSARHSARKWLENLVWS